MVQVLHFTNNFYYRILLLLFVECILLDHTCTITAPMQNFSTKWEFSIDVSIKTYISTNLLPFIKLEDLHPPFIALI